MPVSSSGSRTALALASGARSQGYSLVVAVAVVMVLMFAGPLLSAAPRAGLAALVIYAAVHLIDVAAFRSLWRFNKVEFGVAVVTGVGVLVVGILFGVLIAVGLSVLAMAARVARPHAAALGYVPGLAGMHDVHDFDEVREVPGLLIYRYDSPVFFANSENFIQQANELIAQRQPGLRWMALNCEAIVDIDSTAAEALRRLIAEVEGQGVQFCLVRAKRELIEQLQAAGLADLIGMDRMYPTLPSLVEAFRDEAA
jgi:MFS superfamily sulfate permease-like transporter